MIVKVKTESEPNTAKEALDSWRRALERTTPSANAPPLILPLVIDNLAEQFGAAPALLDDDETLSYRGLAERVNRYARWALDAGLGPGDVVCLLLPNCSDYMAIWLGITRIGATAALLNTSLSGASLIHAIAVASPRHLIVGAPYRDVFARIQPHLATRLCCWAHRGTIGDLPRIDQAVESRDGQPIDRAIVPGPSVTDRALLIYTSGTTGLPKAANVSHHRVMQWSYWFAGLMDTRPSDRMYNCLPMYHSIGGVVATASLLVSGGSVVIRPHFSVSRFWEEISVWQCTLFQYIGELCRYLVNSPPRPGETTHRLRLCCGNGLRGDIWQTFKRRFDIPRILEFYAATEANFSLYNCEGEPGAIGKIPAFLGHRFQVALVAFDVDTSMPVRDSAGFCIRCGPNEVGEAIGKIDQGAGRGHRFEGYADADATERKILRNVFTEGDAWFRTGDLMRKDKRGFFYFIDRVGDTFRWKGENVSSQEVAETIAACPGVASAVVYGVGIPGMEGRAGMAAIVADGAFEWAILRQHLVAHLPYYAHPLFWRLCTTLETTVTFRPRKQVLADEGYNPHVTADAIVFEDRTGRGFIPMDAALYARIQTGELRL